MNTRQTIFQNAAQDARSDVPGMRELYPIKLTMN